MPLDHLLEMEHVDLAARCYTAELERDEWKRESDLSKWPKEAAQEYHQMKAALRQIALADLPPGERPAESDWHPSFWQWAPKVARQALGMEPYEPDWGWNGIV